MRLAIEGGCNAVASTFGVLGSVARGYAHRIPFIVKLNHNELLTYPNHYDQILFGTVKEAWEMGAVAVGAAIYFGSEHSDRQCRGDCRMLPHRAYPGNGNGALVLRTQFGVQDGRQQL